MRKRVAIASLALVLLEGSAIGQSLTVFQNRRANVFGIVEVGRDVGSVTVVQSGQANVTGIMQFGGNPRAKVSQNGGVNSAFVGQYGGVTIPIGRSQMP